MKLKTFDASTCNEKASVKKPVISMNTKSGMFRFNQAACEFMDLKAEDHIIFHQDEKSEEDWYLEVVKSGGFELLYRESLCPKGLLFNKVAVATAIAKSVEFDKQSGHLLIGNEPVSYQSRTLWPIITLNLKK